MTCPSCGTENAAGKRFCVECGTPLALACPSCGAALSGGEKFCGDCGAALSAQPREVGAQAAQPTAERRLVSVLFADLVGFTAASEGRDAEETRDLLSRYFDTCRTLIERYGGTVEKFIGDAVMAVWGTPVAQEDDAERAVRAALELVAAVPDLHSALKARAGVLTGEAAVTLAAEGQGMVAGDLVNTASRLQSAAEPGTVLVGDSTRRASEAAIAYEDAGKHELKGKAEPVHLWRANRVTAARGGALKSAGLESPFVGRERELRLIKELFHGSAEEGTAHLVSVVGVAGIGKSRIGWELYKYIDGLVDLIRWHRGRCLAYGEGVAYWALAEMVRSRAEIVEAEEPASAREKLRASVREFVSDAEEQSWVEPRLSSLLGLDETPHDRDDLFAAWRLFFERMSEREPVVLVFEDMQWAERSLLEFVEYLLEWSRDHPIFVVTLARPELLERHPEWASGKRNATTLTLEPLRQQAMEELLRGLVPGLPDEIGREILARAEGVPLYAMETVRMLLDRGLLERAGDRYRPTGPIEELEIPETLHALVAARLDALEPAERSLVQNAAVLGKTFTKEALAAVHGGELDFPLTSLVRKEVLSLQTDPRSPERGQYGFLQELVRRIAYETLARRERKARHLAAAAHLELAFRSAEHEVAEVVASHYLAAFEAAPEAEDAAVVKGKAGEMLARAGERAASLGAAEEAERYFTQAAGIADDPLLEAALRERAGQEAWRAGSLQRGRTELEQALMLFEEQGRPHAAARAAARLGVLEWLDGALDQALERMERAFAVLAQDEPDADVALVAAELGRLHFFRDELDVAAERIETALTIAESLRLPETTSHALNTAALIAQARGRPEQSRALFKHALELALEHDLSGAALRAYNNLATQLDGEDRYDEAIGVIRRGIELARRVGDRAQEWRHSGELSWYLCRTGRWDEALEVMAAIPEVARAEGGAARLARVEIECGRGRRDAARRVLAGIAEDERSPDVQARAHYTVMQAKVLRLEGRYREALDVAQEALRERTFGVGGVEKWAMTEALEAAYGLGDLERLEELVSWLDRLPPGELTPSLDGHRARFRGHLAAARGERAEAANAFATAAAIFREFSLVFPLAQTLLEHGEWLVGEGRHEEAEPLLSEAREIFERLEATPWIERAAGVGGAAAVA